DLLPVQLDGTVIRTLRTDAGYSKERLVDLVNAQVPEEVNKAGIPVANDDPTVSFRVEVLEELERGERTVCVFHHQARALAYVLKPREDNPRFLYASGHRSAFVPPEVVLTYIEETALPEFVQLILDHHVMKSDEVETGGFVDSRPRDKGRV